MSANGRLRSLLQAFVDVAASLRFTDIDLQAFLLALADRFVDLFWADQVAMVVGYRTRDLLVVVSTSDDARELELLQIDIRDGPCIHSYETGRPVVVADIYHDPKARRWPEFCDAAAELNLRSVVALPMRAGKESIGAVNLFGRGEASWSDDDLHAAQALADFAALGITNGRALSDARQVTEQLQSALDSRILIEQAKGMVAEGLGVTTSHAFGLIRDHARSNTMKLHDVSQAIVQRELAAGDLLAARIPAATV